MAIIHCSVFFFNTFDSTSSGIWYMYLLQWLIDGLFAGSSRKYLYLWIGWITRRWIRVSSASRGLNKIEFKYLISSSHSICVILNSYQWQRLLLHRCARVIMVDFFNMFHFWGYTCTKSHQIARVYSYKERFADSSSSCSRWFKVESCPLARLFIHIETTTQRSCRHDPVSRYRTKTHFEVATQHRPHRSEESPSARTRGRKLHRAPSANAPRSIWQMRVGDHASKRKWDWKKTNS